jgi:hypothetical protein
MDRGLGVLAMDGKRCGAKSTQTGKPCQRWPIKGGRRCPKHGGATPAAKAAAAATRAEGRIRAELGKLQIVPITDPLTELSHIAGEVLAWKNLAAEQWEHLTSMRYEGMSGEQLRAEIAVWERALDRCVTTLATIAKLNIDERLVALDEKRAALVNEAINRLLDHLALGAEQRAEAKGVVARHLRSLAGGAA